ncbi:3-hydroxyacyl-CoA dehydrogenase [Biformimicrobium ophioploci]|uniref:3-hydroxyacyl-CoA dehydrogenase n=2 Tax=Biformimicrobium ophioploci TaxID=3036711 RepID=A0ABQ6LYC9_9GAMM|nr:3-hydroxyacyl-CoA dehydrogenase [Microbulbifer sp. NKW57]
MTQSTQQLSVLGAGVLGGQIGWHSAFKGKNVTIYDISEESLERCRKTHANYAQQYIKDLGASNSDIEKTRRRIIYTTDLQDAGDSADIVIEAVPEIPKIKIDLYEKLAKYLPDHTIVATNSSTLLPSEFAQHTGRPDRFCALHFANLIWISNLAEIMVHPDTSEETVRIITEFAIEIGMVPIPVLKEKNGYVLNTWLVALLNSSQSLITNGVSRPEEIDRTFMIVNRGTKFGPCGMMDIIGMKTCYDILHHWGEHDNDEQMKKNADYIKTHFLDKGKQGMLGGEGYYTYPKPEFLAKNFLEVPDKSMVNEIVRNVLNK